MTTNSTTTHVHLETFGCQMNEYDSELVRSLMKQDGFVFTDERERADVILMNTCAIRENAHNKVYKHLSELKKLKRQRSLGRGRPGLHGAKSKRGTDGHSAAGRCVCRP